MKSNKKRLTIVTVAGPNSEGLVSRNVQLIKHLNPEELFNFFVVDNSIFSGGKKVQVSKDWSLIDGVDMVDKKLFGINYASMHHSLALNKFFRDTKIDEKYCLVIDPDFFVLKKNWISKILDLMESEDLSLIGAPWHPKWFTKYREFPCVHFFLFNTSRINPESIDFTPTAIEKSEGILKKGLIQKIKNFYLMRLFISIFLLRFQIGLSQDTGYKIYKDQILTSENILNFKLFTPVINKGDFDKVEHLRFKIGRLIERLFPEKIAFLPKKRNLLSYESRIRDEIKEEVISSGWEEFQFRKDIFGVHMRNFPSKESKKKLDLDLLDNLIKLHTE